MKALPCKPTDVAEPTIEGAPYDQHLPYRCQSEPQLPVLPNKDPPRTISRGAAKFFGASHHDLVASISGESDGSHEKIHVGFPLAGFDGFAPAHFW